MKKLKRRTKKKKILLTKKQLKKIKLQMTIIPKKLQKKKFLRKIRTNLMKLLKTSLSRIQKQMKRRKNLMIRLILNLLRRINQKNQKFTIAKKIIK